MTLPRPGSPCPPPHGSDGIPGSQGFYRAAEASLHVLAAAPTGESLLLELQREAMELGWREPFLAPLVHGIFLEARSLAEVMALILGRRLAGGGMPAERLAGLIKEILEEDEDFPAALAADLLAVRTRDPACPSFLHAMANLKGFHALQTHRVAHALWRRQRRDLALWLANLAAVAFAVDIHPAARLGRGLMLDHGTGIVIGETAVVEDDVSMLQNVTLGGTGKEHGDRHPKVRHGVLIGAGAKVLGNIEVGARSKIAAGSIVLKSVPPLCTVAGIPARVIRYLENGQAPAAVMDHQI